MITEKNTISKKIVRPRRRRLRKIQPQATEPKQNCIFFRRLVSTLKGELKYMAFKTAHVVPSSLPRPNSYSFSPSRSCYQPKPPTRNEARISLKNQHESSPVLRCRANVHGHLNEAVPFPQDHTAEIPIVLHPSVLFPGETLRLQTFEFRYRIMMQTLLQVQEGLSFGIIYSARRDDRIADVGCIANVLECERLVDDRFFLTCIGGDRFRVLEVVRTKPYVTARITVLNDRDSPNSGQHRDLGCLMQQVEGHLNNVTMLSDKLNWKLRGDNLQAGQVSGVHSPESFSFRVANLFIDDLSEKQWLLRLDDTAQRLVREGRYLEKRSKYLAAIAAIKGAFGLLSCNE